MTDTVSPPQSALGVSDYHLYFVAQGDNELKISYLKRNIVPLLDDLARSARILEVGPGRGELLKLLREAGFENLHAFEICSQFANALSQKGFSISTGSSALEYLRAHHTSSMDALLLVDVLEHLALEEGLAFLSECRRVLAPHGRMIIQTPNASGIFGLNTFVADPTHATPWNELRLTSALKGAGFSSVECLPMMLPLSLGNQIRELGRDILFSIIRFLTRLCGATPIRVLTHNIVCVAR